MGKRMKILTALGLALIIAAGVLYGIFFGTQPADETENDQQLPGTLSALSADEANQTQILLAQDGIEIDGSGASAAGTTVLISQAGTYAVSGTLENGQIDVAAGNEDEVVLVLNGVTLSNEEEAAIYVESAGQTQLILEAGTVNRFESGTQTDFSAIKDSADNNATGAAVYAKDDLSISGTGSLQVYGYINNGVHSADNLLIDSGTFEVTAVNNAIKGKDSVTITDGDFTICSGGDGIKSDDTTGEGYGVISISGGKFSIESSSDGVQAETALSISGGEFSVVSGGSSSASYSSYDRGWGDSDANWDMEDEAAVSTKGIKSGGELNISGGSFTVDSCDDAFHSNGSILISGGNYEIASGDDGMHADTELVIKSGDIQITQSYEGIEGNQIQISGGDISVVSYDDGMNAYGGQNNRGWGGSAKTTEETPELVIKGGTISVDADGDGLDSNGTLCVEGGTVVVNGPSDGGNGAIDSGSENGGDCIVNGGIVLAVGSSGMAETFSGNSEQYSFCCNLTDSFTDGDDLTISDEQGNILFQHTIVKSGSSVVFSSPDLVSGETYVLTVGGQTTEIKLESVSTTSGQASHWR
ncbi:MAG: carbohydrate-binding domain-containing protein [Clostridiaceae bacterium]|nr:carbohydrate-binding domain-containing protein [Clostridiaceae bacterium]